MIGCILEPPTGGQDGRPLLADMVLLPDGNNTVRIQMWTDQSKDKANIATYPAVFAVMATIGRGECQTHTMRHKQLWLLFTLYIYLNYTSAIIYYFIILPHYPSVLFIFQIPISHYVLSYFVFHYVLVNIFILELSISIVLVDIVLCAVTLLVTSTCASQRYNIVQLPYTLHACWWHVCIAGKYDNALQGDVNAPHMPVQLSKDSAMGAWWYKRASAIAPGVCDGTATDGCYDLCAKLDDDLDITVNK